jgi:uncharacterized protein
MGPSTVGPMVRGFFENGGTRAYVAGSVDALDPVDEIELLCTPPAVNDEAIALCERRGDRLAILSLPAGVGGVEDALAARPALQSGYAAVHYPWVLAGGELVPPGGHVAGVYARTKPGATASAVDVRGLGEPPLERSLSDSEVTALGDGRVNPLRDLRPAGLGVRVWGTRTLDSRPDWKYVAIRRLIMFVERSIEQGLQWVESEPNAEPLWAAVRGRVGDFLLTQWLSGALQGARPDEAFFVRCDHSTMTQEDLDSGRLVCLVGVAPVRPAEFVIIRIGQWTSDHSQ